MFSFSLYLFFFFFFVHVCVVCRSSNPEIFHWKAIELSGLRSSENNCPGCSRNFHIVFGGVILRMLEALDLYIENEFRNFQKTQNNYVSQHCSCFFTDFIFPHFPDSTFNLVSTQNFPKTIISYLLISTRVCAYQGVRNSILSEHFAYVLNE